MQPVRTTLPVLLAGLAVLTAGTALVAQPGPGHHGPMGPMAERFVEHRLDRLAEYLELSDAQRVEAEALRERVFADVKERIATAGATFEAIHAMAAAENPDATAIGELVIQMHRDREAKREAHDAFRAELVALLTPEQVERLEAWEAARPWGDHRGPGFHHGLGFHHGPGGGHGEKVSEPDED